MKLSDFGLELREDGTLFDLRTENLIDRNSRNALGKLTRAIYNNFHIRGATPTPSQPFERLTDRDFSLLYDRFYPDEKWLKCLQHSKCITKDGLHLSDGDHATKCGRNITVFRHQLHLNASWGWHAYIPSSENIDAGARIYVGGKTTIDDIVNIVDVLHGLLGDNWRLKFAYLSMSDRPDAITIYLPANRIQTVINQSPSVIHFKGQFPGFASVKRNIAYAVTSEYPNSESFGWTRSRDTATTILSDLYGGIG